MDEFSRIDEIAAQSIQRHAGIIISFDAYLLAGAWELYRSLADDGAALEWLDNLGLWRDAGPLMEMLIPHAWRQDAQVLVCDCIEHAIGLEYLSPASRRTLAIVRRNVRGRASAADLARARQYAEDAFLLASNNLDFTNRALQRGRQQLAARNRFAEQLLFAAFAGLIIWLSAGFRVGMAAILAALFVIIRVVFRPPDMKRLEAAFLRAQRRYQAAAIVNLLQSPAFAESPQNVLSKALEDCARTTRNLNAERRWQQRRMFYLIEERLRGGTLYTTTAGRKG